MPESIIGDEVWCGLTAIERIEVVRDGRATLQQLTHGLLAGSEELRSLCRDVLANTRSGLSSETAGKANTKANDHHEPASADPDISKARAGLPIGFTLTNRSQRTRLLEDNVYRLPDGREFVPCIPQGALGAIGHRYALLTIEQYQQSRKGSVYIRMDGRIFDYSNAALSANDFFDTGFRMDDLERTGRYVSRPANQTPKNKKTKPS